MFKIDINYNRKSAKVLEVDFAALDEKIQQSVIAYGLRQVLNDAGSSAKSADEKIAFAEKKLDGLVRGVWAQRRAAGPTQSGFDKYLVTFLAGLLKERDGGTLADARKKIIENHGATEEEVVPSVGLDEEAVGKLRAQYELTQAQVNIGTVSL